MNTREIILINELKEEVRTHDEQIAHYEKHIDRNTHAKKSHESKRSEALDLLNKLSEGSDQH